MASVITGSSCGDAWKRGVRFLLKNGTYVPSIRGPVIECLNLALVVLDPWSAEGRISKLSPSFRQGDQFGSSLVNDERILNWHGENQLEKVVSALRGDPLSRRAVIAIWDPQKDYEDDKSAGLIAFVFAIRQKKLHMTGLMRTTDAWMCNWTLASFPELQKTVWEALCKEEWAQDIVLGTYTQTHCSFHLYLDDWKDAQWRLGS
ncbi:MAG: hypothetical protein ABSG55_01900 [Dehalococcoidia bacterium]|jgi:thymidylate synthase